jgi:hypothetical protein
MIRLEELLRVLLFIGDECAEDHYDGPVTDGRGAGVKGGPKAVAQRARVSDA